MTALAHSNKHGLAGTFTFMKGYRHPGLYDAMKALRRLDVGEWVDIHTRTAGDGRTYLSFHIILKDGREKTARRAGHSIVGVLVKHLGHWPRYKSKPLGVTKWSISNVELTA